MAGTFHVEIVTPQETVFEGDVASITLPGSIGPFQVLVNHAPIVTGLETGDIKILGTDNKEVHFATSGGFAEMKKNRLTVIADAVENAAEIDVARAERARDRADERIREARRMHDKSIDMERAEAALARAQNRIKVATHSRV